MQIAALWLKAGGPADQLTTAVAVALAESSGRIKATHTNSNGSIDYGIWQVNSVNGATSASLDPLTNAREAVAVYKSQGWGAWTTYNSGAYKNNFSVALTAAQTATASTADKLLGALTPLIGVGAAAALPEGSAVEGGAAGVGGAVAKGAASGATSSLARDIGIATVLAWLTTAKNWLRVLEFVGGAIAIYMALRALTGADVPGPAAVARKVAL